MQMAFGVAQKDFFYKKIFVKVCGTCIHVHREYGAFLASSAFFWKTTKYLKLKSCVAL